MRIGLDDIDPEIGKQLQERLNAPLQNFLHEDIHWRGHFPYQFNPHNFSLKRKRQPTEDERHAYELRQRRSMLGIRGGLMLLGSLTLPPVIGFALGALIWNLTQSDYLAWGTTLMVWLAGSSAGVMMALNANRSTLTSSISLEEMRAVFPNLPMSRAERIYCDTLLLLARLDTRPEAEVSIRETLRQLTDLVVTSRQLEERRRALIPVLGTNPVRELEKEYGELGRRYDQTTDSLAKQAIKQSLEMCASRLENARAFEAGLERLKAQEEAILQTLSSAQTALARMQILSEPQIELTAQQIAENVTEMNRQTYAIEQAIEEVMTIRVQ